MFSIDQLVADCLEAVRSEGRSGSSAVREVIQRTVSDPGVIDDAIGSAAALPVFSIWHNDDELTVLHVVWPPEVDLFAHDHKTWAAIGLYGGREDNRLFRVLPEGDLELRSTRTLRGGDTVLLGDDAVHAVANPSSKWTGAIHVYGGDYFRSGRRMWPDASCPPIEFDTARVVSVLDDAAQRAGSPLRRDHLQREPPASSALWDLQLRRWGRALGQGERRKVRVGTHIREGLVSEAQVIKYLGISTTLGAASYRIREQLRNPRPSERANLGDVPHAALQGTRLVQDEDGAEDREVLVAVGRRDDQHREG